MECLVKEIPRVKREGAAWHWLRMEFLVPKECVNHNKHFCCPNFTGLYIN